VNLKIGSSAYPEDYVPTALQSWYARANPVILQVLTSPKYYKAVFGSSQSGNLLIQPPIDLINGDDMNGNKSQRTRRGNSKQPDESPSFRWVNAPLTDEDYDILERTETDLESLAAMLIGLVGRSYGVSVKFDSVRERFNCVVYRSFPDNNGRGVGLSGHAPNVRDAILVTLYRFESKCGGDLVWESGSDSSDKRERRFG